MRAIRRAFYISMFDEYNEGNQIAKTAESQAWTPTGSGFLALDEDGTACSSDYYLRLTGDGGRMLKGQLALTAVRPTPPTTDGGADTTAPTPPANLHVTDRTSTSLALAWNAATDNVGVTDYRVLRVDGSTATQVGAATGTSFTVTGLTPSTGYTFQVTALDAAGGVSQPSNQVTATTGTAGSGTDLALHRPTSESSHTQVYGSGNAVDDDPNSYWESANNAFPQWIQVDLGAATAVRRIVLTLPPSSSWGTRTQTGLGPGRRRRQQPRPGARRFGLQVRPGRRQHRHPHPAPGHRHPVRAAHLHGQHRVAGRPALRVQGLRGLTAQTRAVRRLRPPSPAVNPYSGVRKDHHPFA